MPKSRYEMLKYLMPLFLVLYVAGILLSSAVDDNREILPFYNWRLFSSTPSWEVVGNGVIVRSIDGDPIQGDRYLIPNSNIRDTKVLSQTVRACTQDRNCDEEVERVLYPVISQLVGENSAEFSIVRIRIDLRDIQMNIKSIADGTVERSEFYHPYREIGTWTIQEGYIS